MSVEIGVRGYDKYIDVEVEVGNATFNEGFHDRGESISLALSLLETVDDILVILNIKDVFNYEELQEKILGDANE